MSVGSLQEQSQFFIAQSGDIGCSIDVKLDGETVWLSQQQMSELFQTDRTSILRHIRNIYTTEELEENSTCAFFAQVREEGPRTVTRRIPYYNLDMIISVGYRVNSKRGTQFRIWANKVLKEYLIKGFAINDKITQRKYEELSQLVLTYRTSHFTHFPLSTSLTPNSTLLTPNFQTYVPLCQPEASTEVTSSVISSS